ncbi:MAG: nucleoside triphosphate pyrophosphohydrolase [Mycobacteriales bacterium]
MSEPFGATMDRLVLIANTHRVAPGLLSWEAWQALRDGDVYCADAAHPQLPFLEAAGVGVQILRAGADLAGLRVGYLLGGGDPGAVSIAQQFREKARSGRAAVWLASGGGDPDFVRALGDLAAREGGVELEVVYGSYDMPGARLLDLVSTMDRLRSPGGCPWDAKQTHETLAHYLVEETYEALDAIEGGDLAGLREELGDVLLQVVFHARVAQEREDGTGWTIDDVAGGIVEKLVSRHPHVFGDVEVSGADEVVDNWEQLKAAEKGRTSVTDGVPLGQPALALAAKLQKRALRAGLPAPLVAEHVAAAETLPQAVAAAAAAVADAEDPDRTDAVGDLLFTVAVLAQAVGVDAEAALRGTAKRFRDRLATLERSALQDEVALDALDEPQWRARWEAAAVPIFADEADDEYDEDPDLGIEPEEHDRRFHE